MKKIIKIVFVLGIVVLASCTKNHVCSCVKTTNTNGVIGEYPVEESVINNMSTSDAIDKCNAGDTQSSQGNSTITINCELKD